MNRPGVKKAHGGIDKLSSRQAMEGGPLFVGLKRLGMSVDEFLRRKRETYQFEAECKKNFPRRPFTAAELAAPTRPLNTANLRGAPPVDGMLKTPYLLNVRKEAK